MTTMDRIDDRTDRTTAEPAFEQKQTMLDHLGGPSGMVYTTLPVVVFAATVPFAPLPITIGIAVAVALVLAAVRLLRGEKFTAAFGGVFGVAAAGGVAAWTGSANDFFLIGIWASLAGAVVTLASLLARRPITGAAWNALHGGTHRWREDRPSLRAHYIATLAATTVFTARFIVKEWLYLADSTGWLAFAKVAMGTPLTALAAVVVVWAFRRTTKRLLPSHA
ncbi:DUF3159 domain-containing protein [Saccharopolyspora sp. NFXS83]|uniref:DUF3159 domain-containing protein n=1 Tax=Saccharopolyspora sp. NFXS83 TaxID=2993560 RepID=UPI00224B45AA|nr:DUF3159 domain-containing protein [Saccharopolyspora sp. NFXS83]MCX2731450.1 DUF3159 domain-containing protein [Saccharopolyspora sp. NFXS83]